MMEKNLMKMATLMIASAIRKCMTVTEDAQDINSKLQTMSTEDSLPSWWTNKLAVASNDMNKMRDYIVNPVQEEVELDEAKYDLYHKDFSSAMQHSYKMAKKLHGITVDPKEIDDKVASGPRKPSEGKTNSYRLKGDKGAIQVQVYNKGGSKPFELNMYKEEVDLDENKGLENKSKKSGVSVGILKKVYSRGLAAYKTGHRPGTTAPQWAMARVNSFLTGGGARKADADLWKQAKGQKEEVELDEAPAKVWHLANKKFNLISDKGGYILVKQGSGEEKRLKAKTPADATAELVKKGYREEVELGEGTILVADPKTQKVIKIDEKDWPKYEKKGYVQAEGNELDEASARADAKRAMRKDRGVDPADVDSSATDDDVKAASKNIIMQLRKSVSLRGNFPVEFMDKKKVKVDAKIASAVQDKYNSMRKADDKEKFQAKIAKSYKDMLSALKESIAEGGYVGRKDPMPAGKELAKLMKKKGKKKKESTILDRIDQKVQERKNG